MKKQRKTTTPKEKTTKKKTNNKSNHWKDKTIKIKEMDETDVWLLASNN